jgi:O-antigen ligase
MNKAIPVLLLVAVVFTTAAHGAVEPWSAAIYGFIVITTVLLWVVKSFREKRLVIRVPSTAFPVIGLVALGLVQSVAFAGGDGRVRSLSTDVEATRGAVTMLSFLLFSFIIAANFFTNRDRLHRLASFLVIYGLVVAVFALVQHFTWDGRFYWLRPTRGPAFGPFVNRNHFAGYMEMLIPIPIALIITRGVRREAWLMFGFAAVVMGLALVVSLSRGGMISLAAGLVFLAFLSARGRSVKGESSPVRASLVIPAVIVAAIVVGVFWIGVNPVMDRIAQTLDEVGAQETRSAYTDRAWLWRDTWTMIRANPLTGVGLGAYQTAYPAYGHGDGALIVDYAHNDYLQALADGGVVAFALALWFVVLLMRATLRAAKSDDPLLRGMAIGCGAGLFALLTHSLFDFNLQIPSNALLFLVHSAVVSYIGAQAIERISSEAALRARRAKAGDITTGVSS